MLRFIAISSFYIGAHFFSQQGFAENAVQSGSTKDNRIVFVPAQKTTRLSSGAIFAKANIESRSLSQVRGLVWFTQTKDGVLVVAELEGLAPGPHGFHIHEFGDCSAQDGSSAGGHFNPTNKKHGSPDAPEHHAGDLGNIVADNNGYAYYQRLDKDLTLSGPNSIIGRSIIVHKDADDFTTQPAGNSGIRIGCGEIFEIAVE